MCEFCYISFLSSLSLEYNINVVCKRCFVFTFLWPQHFLHTEPQDSPVKMDVEEQGKTEPSPRKTKLTGDTRESPSKQRMARQKQSVKLKLEALMQKEPELTRRRPVRQASRKSFYSDSLNLLLVGAIISNWSSVPLSLSKN